MSRTFTGVVAFIACGVLAAAQNPAPPVFPTQVGVIKVAATVQDDRGRLVTDLKADDFLLREDGRPQGIEVFARAFETGNDETLALDLGLLLDTSRSMINVLKLSQEAAVRFLESIPRARDLLVVFFDQDIRISRYDSESQQGLFHRIHAAKGGGNTALYDSIAVYLSRVQNTKGRKVLVLLTDGQDSTSSLNQSDVLELVRSTGVTIYPVAITADGGSGMRSMMARSFLFDLANLTGGQVFRPVASKDLAPVYRAILNDLSYQYVIGYVSDNRVPDGKYRKLKIEVKRKGLRVRHRAGYLQSLQSLGAP